MTFARRGVLGAFVIRRGVRLSQFLAMFSRDIGQPLRRNPIKVSTWHPPVADRTSEVDIQVTEWLF